MLLPSPSAEPLALLDETPITIRGADDVVIARQCGRTAAVALGFSHSEVTLIAAAITEVTSNIVKHARHGEITLRAVEKNRRRGLQIIARDEGPGIADVVQTMKYDYSVSRGIDMGLPGAKWLVDEFDLASIVDRGTTVTMVKWLPLAVSARPAA